MIGAWTGRVSGAIVAKNSFAVSKSFEPEVDNFSVPKLFEGASPFKDIL